MNLLFCINQKFLPLLQSCLKSILAKGGYDHYDAYILHSDFQQDAIDQVDTWFPGRVDFHFIQVPDSLFDGFPETERYPKEIYYRLAAPFVLPHELDRVLYLDVDTVVINSLKELYESEFGECYYVGCTHTNHFLTKINMVRLGSLKAVSYVNSGVLLFNLPALRENISLQDICSYANSRRGILILPDQDILTALYGDKVKIVDSMRYNLSDRILSFYNADPANKKLDLDWVRQNAVIIHYCGKNKPWNEKYNGILDVFYKEL